MRYTRDKRFEFLEIFAIASLRDSVERARANSKYKLPDY